MNATESPRNDSSVRVSPEIPVYDNSTGTPVDSLALPDGTLLANSSSGQVSDRWQTIQVGFVDDPRRAVSEAHALVAELVQRIVDSFTSERDALEQQWQSGGDVSTEELRLCLQRYRGFFTRLAGYKGP
jgi:hypothetical protein